MTAGYAISNKHSNGASKISLTVVFMDELIFLLELDSGKEPQVNMSGELIRDDLPWKEAYNDPTSTEYKQLAEDTCKQVSKGKHTSNHGNCIIHYCPYRAIQAMYRCNVKLMIM